MIAIVNIQLITQSYVSKRESFILIEFMSLCGSNNLGKPN